MEMSSISNSSSSAGLAFPVMGDGTAAAAPALAIRSSNHRDRTPRDRKTDRAFHLVRFFGTDEETPAPPYDSDPRVRREIIEPPAVELTEEEKKKGLAVTGQRPGESAEAYEIRKQVMRKARNKDPEWRWVLEDGKRQNRWEGKEDLTQTSNYVVMFPPTEPGGDVRVALLDHWIDMRKFIDNTARKKELQGEMMRKNVQQAMKRNKMKAAKHIEEAGDGRGKGRLGRTVTWIAGRESESTTRRYKKSGVIDSDEEDGERGPRGDDRGVNVEDVDAENDVVDHEHGLAIDRMQEDGDEFQDVEYEFDDDEEIVPEQIAAEDNDGLLDGNVAVTEAVQLDAEEDFEEEAEEDEEEDGPARPLSSSDSDKEEEEEEEEEEPRPVRPGSRVPAPTQAPPAAAAASIAAAQQATSRPLPVSQQATRAPSLEQQMKEFIIQTVRTNHGRTVLPALLKAIAGKFGAGFDRQLVVRLVKEMLVARSNQIDGDFFVLKDEYL